jgi:hypothetical protein
LDIEKVLRELREERAQLQDAIFTMEPFGGWARGASRTPTGVGKIGGIKSKSRTAGPTRWWQEES